MRKVLNHYSCLVGSKKTLDKQITIEEVSWATLKLNNNRAAGPGRILVKLVKYAPVEVHVFIQELLNHVLEYH